MFADISLTGLRAQGTHAADVGSKDLSGFYGT